MSGNSSSRDQRAYPQRPVVGVAAVVLRQRDETVLLIERGREPMLGRWSLPGGALELGETLENAAMREVFEETALRVVPREMVATVDRIVRDEEDRIRYHYVLVDWWCEVLDETLEPSPGDDARAARWVSQTGIDGAEYALEEMTLTVIRKAVAMAGWRNEARER